MSGSDNKNKKNNSKAPSQKVKVLYQNLGGQWYAFTNVGEEVYFSKVSLKEKGVPPNSTVPSSKKKPKTV